jgi:hypothetical protein
MRWEVLPAALKHAMQAIMLLPSLTELHLCFLSMPAALLRLVAASVPSLKLSYVVIEDAQSQSLPMAPPALRKLMLDGFSESVVTFLTTPGAPTAARLSFTQSAQWDRDYIHKILQGSASTLTQLHFDIARIDASSLFFKKIHQTCLRWYQTHTLSPPP